MRAKAAFALAALALWHLALHWRGMSLPMISDEGEYAYQAQLIARGGAPYRDAYNQKPPAVFFLYRASHVLFGENERSPRLLALFFSWATMLLLFFTTPAAWTLPSRLAAPAVFAALGAAPIGDMGFAANTEIFLCAFTALAAWALARDPRPRRTALAGLAMGAALMTKQTAVWTVAAFAGLLLFEDRKNPRRPFLFAAGCALAPAAAVIFFLVRGGILDFWDQAFARNMDYAAVLSSASALKQQLSWLARVVAPLFLIAGWPAYGLALYGLAFTRLEKGRHWEALATLWLAAALIGIATGLYFFPHYFLQALPPLALVCALGLENLGRRWNLASSLWLLLAAVTLYPAAAHARLYFREPPLALARELLYPNPLFEARTVAEHLKSRSGPEDKIYVFGSEPQIYVYSGRRAATRHIFVYPLTLFPRGAGQIKRELSLLEETPPRFIVYVNIPGSTLVASTLGEIFRIGMLWLLNDRYRMSGFVPVKNQGPIAFAPAIAGPFAPERLPEGLFVFERR